MFRRRRKRRKLLTKTNNFSTLPHRLSRHHSNFYFHTFFWRPKNVVYKSKTNSWSRMCHVTILIIWAVAVIMRLVEHRKCHLGCSTFFSYVMDVPCCVHCQLLQGSISPSFFWQFLRQYSMLIILAYDIYKKRKRWVEFQVVFSSKVGRCFVGETEWREQ